VFDHEFAVGPRYPGSLGPAGTAGYRRVTMTAEFDKDEAKPMIKLAFTGSGQPDLAHAFTS
jgi:hypothetical protein